LLAPRPGRPRSGGIATVSASGVAAAIVQPLVRGCSGLRGAAGAVCTSINVTTTAAVVLRLMAERANIPRLVYHGRPAVA
jgi:hypothetical protein